MAGRAGWRGFNICQNVMSRARRLTIVMNISSHRLLLHTAASIVIPVDADHFIDMVSYVIRYKDFPGLC